MRVLVDVFAAGIPKGQPRPRAFARNGKARVYDPGTAEAWKGEIAVAVGPRHPEEGPIGVDLGFVLPRPKSHYGAHGIIKRHAPIYHTSKPDLDNAIKAVLDTLTTMRVWQDDAQVASLNVTKRYEEADPTGCAIRVYRIPDPSDGGSHPREE